MNRKGVELIFNEDTMQMITCNDNHSFAVSKMLTELMKDFDIGYSKNIGQKTIEIICHNEDFDKLVSKMYGLDDSFDIKLLPNKGFCMVDKTVTNSVNYTY